MSPIPLLEGFRHFGHRLVQERVLVPMPGVRLIPWIDRAQPGNWGLGQDRMDEFARLIRPIFASLPPEFRYLQPVCGLRRCVDPTFPGDHPGDWTATITDVQSALLTDGHYPCEQDILLLTPLMRKLRSWGLLPAGIWIDNENWLDFLKSSNLLWAWHMATGTGQDELDSAARHAIHKTARTLADAFGLTRTDVITVEANEIPNGRHWWDSSRMPVQPLSGRLYCHVNPALSPADFRASLQLACDRGAYAVFIFAENVTADELDQHEQALRDLTRRPE